MLTTRFQFPGGGTISAALCALLFYLSRHPSCYQRVASEVRTTFATDADIRSGPKLARCKYLRACFDEALRLSPPVGGTLWRELPANDTKSLTIQGHVIPKGTQVGVSIYSIHHNAKYFPDPFSFRPERWLQGDEEGVKLRTEGMYNAFTPFSSGPRGCEGKAMAYTEAGLVVAKLLMRFDFDRCNKDGYTDVGGGTGVPRELRGRREEFQMYDHFSASHDGPCLVLRARTR